MTLRKALISLRSIRQAPDCEGKRSRTRRRVLASTFRLLGREDGLTVRIEQICADAQVSRGTFYNHFASLDELFRALALELTHDFNRAVISTLTAIDSRAERTNAAIQHYLNRAHTDPAWGWAMVRLSAHGPIFGSECTDSCARTMREGIQAGEFDCPNEHIARDLMMGTMLAATLSLLQSDGRPRTRPRTVARVLLRALGVPDSRAREITERPLPRIEMAAASHHSDGSC